MGKLVPLRSHQLQGNAIKIEAKSCSISLKHCSPLQLFATLISTKHSFVEIAKSPSKFKTRLEKRKKGKIEVETILQNSAMYILPTISKITEQILNEWRDIDPRLPVDSGYRGTSLWNGYLWVSLCHTLRDFYLEFSN